MAVRAVQPLGPLAYRSNPTFVCTLCQLCTLSVTKLILQFASFLFWLSFSRPGAIQRRKSDYVIPVCAGPKPPSCPKHAARELLPPADQFLHYTRLQFYFTHFVYVCVKMLFFIVSKKCISKVLIQIQKILFTKESR